MMKKFILEIDGERHEATSPKVSHLKKFFGFQKEFEKGGSFDDKTIEALGELIKSVFCDITDKDLQNMDIRSFINTAGDMANWISEAMGNDEKN